MVTPAWMVAHSPGSGLPATGTALQSEGHQPGGPTGGVGRDRRPGNAAPRVARPRPIGPRVAHGRVTRPTCGAPSLAALATIAELAPEPRGPRRHCRPSRPSPPAELAPETALWPPRCARVPIVPATRAIVAFQACLSRKSRVHFCLDQDSVPHRQALARPPARPGRPPGHPVSRQHAPVSRQHDPVSRQAGPQGPGLSQPPAQAPAPCPSASRALS